MLELEEMTEDMKILSDLTRLKILRVLADHKYLCVNAITLRIDVSQSAISQHLRILRQRDFVLREKRAQHIHYSLNEDKLEDLKTKFNDFLK